MTCKLVAAFTDKMTDSRMDRPGWDQLMDYVRPGDALVVTELTCADSGACEYSFPGTAYHQTPAAGISDNRAWIVERTFAWLNRNRRLSKDYEYAVQTSEKFIDFVAIRLMLNQLVRI